MEANAGEYIKNYLHLKSFPRISLHCKLVPVQYRKYEYGLFIEKDEGTLRDAYWSQNASKYAHEFSDRPRTATVRGLSGSSEIHVIKCAFHFARCPSSGGHSLIHIPGTKPIFPWKDPFSYRLCSSFCNKDYNLPRVLWPVHKKPCL